MLSTAKTGTKVARVFAIIAFVLIVVGIASAAAISGLS